MTDKPAAVLSCPGCGNDLRQQASFCDRCGLMVNPWSPEALASQAGGDDIPTTLIAGEEAESEAVRAGDQGDRTRSMRETEPLTGMGVTSGPDPAEPPPQTMPLDEMTQGVFGGDSRPTEADDISTSPPPDVDKAKASTSRELQAGEVLHRRYQVLELLGKGGFGAVYLAQDLKLKRRCVIKQMVTKYWSPKTLRLLRANFEREAKLLVQLNDPGHPNIPEIYDHFFDDEGNYLVMKYIEGRDLKNVLAQSGGTLPVEETIRYAVDLCGALHYMHTYEAESIIHRDIKPGNILLGNDSRVWLVDFGLAKAQPIAETGPMSVTKAHGSFGYSPAEQWFGEATPASDIYALGATLHHLLSGLNPAESFGDTFSILKVQQMHGQFIPLRRVNPHIPEAVAGIVASAVGADPDQRPTALQLQQQLNIFIEGAKDAPLFTFKSSEAATTKGQLVDLCDQYPQEAQGYLYRGDFERWFRLIGRHDLVEAAVQGVKRGKNRRDGLEKFLKLVLPNLFLRRLGRAARRTGAVFLQFGLITAIVLFLTALLGSWVAGNFLQRAIGDYEAWQDAISWQDSYTEAELNAVARRSTGALFDDIFVDIRPPSQLDVNLNWNGLVLALTLEQARQDRPYHFQLTELNGLPLSGLPFIPDNISHGLNTGLDTALCQAGLEITALDLKTIPINAAYVIDAVHLDRTTADCSETAAFLPPVSSPPAVEQFGQVDRPETAAFGIFNQSNHQVLVTLRGPVFTQTTVAARNKRLIDAPPGRYAYSISRSSDVPNAVVRGRLTLTSYYRLEIVE